MEKSQPAIPKLSVNIQNFRIVSMGLSSVPGLNPIILAGAQPLLSGDFRSDGIGELATLYKVKTIIDLQSDEVDRETIECAAAGVEFHSIKLPGIEIFDRLDHAKVLDAVKIVEDRTKWPVFVHCQHGADRTGAVIGCYRIDTGWTSEEAIQEMRKYHNSWLEFGMRDFVEDYYERKIKGDSK